MCQPNSLGYPVLGTAPQIVGAQKMLTERVSPSASHWLLGRERREDEGRL